MPAGAGEREFVSVSGFTRANSLRLIRVLCLFGALLVCSGCLGRISDTNGGRKLDAKTYGLDGVHPSLLVFGAAWCKPCMSEIPSLNRAQSELSGKVRILGFAVEGAQKGVAAAPKDGDLFVSPRGDRPVYKLTVDSAWKLFDALPPVSGHSLPTMVFVSREGVVLRLVQRSLEYDTELLPLLRQLAADQAPVDTAKPGEPTPDPTQGKPQNMTFAAWAALAGNETTSTLYQNVQAGWEQGLGDFNFLEADMPFATARMTVVASDDGHKRLLSAVWIAAATGCKLTVYFKSDGSYDHSNGVCK